MPQSIQNFASPFMFMWALKLYIPSTKKKQIKFELFFVFWVHLVMIPLLTFSTKFLKIFLLLMFFFSSYFHTQNKCKIIVSLKSVHFKKTVARSSVYSKLWWCSIIHQLNFDWTEDRLTLSLKWMDFTLHCTLMQFYHSCAHFWL